MNAFISYSLDEQEQYIVTLLSYKLREHGFSLIISNNNFNVVDITIRNQIFICKLFVGLISSTGLQWERVLEEYNLAVQANTPAILLIEDNVGLEPGFKGNYIYFNRYNPHDAIEEIKRRMIIKQPTNNESFGWILGGAAILGILALIANSNKK